MAEAPVRAKPVVSRINSVYLYVRDVPRSVAFYRDRLDLPFPVEPDPHWAEITFPDGVRFALHQSDAPRPGTVRIDFEVADIDAAAARLSAAGVAVGSISRQPYGSFCEVQDPDGYTVELFQPPQG